MKKEEHSEEIKFLADRMLGRLAKWLRILGYDTVYPVDIGDLALLLRARQENRILLTRDTHLILRKNIGDFLFIKSDLWRDQLREVIYGLKLELNFPTRMFSRCSLCNTPTTKINKDKVRDYVPPYVFLTQNYFVYCPTCKKYYWKGTHWQRIKEKIKDLFPGNN